MTKTEAREYALRSLAAEVRHHVDNGSEWLFHPLRADGIAVDAEGRFTEADARRVRDAVEKIANELENASRRLAHSRLRRETRALGRKRGRAMTPEQEAKIIALCEGIGMPWTRAPGRFEPWNGWNGHELNLASGARASGLIHEIAHWLLSAPEWRRLPGFGLSWKDDERLPPEQLKYGAYYDDEECAASLFGILVERELGFAWRETWSDHNWEDDVGTPGAAWYVRRWFRALQEDGHLRGLTPTCLLDATSSTPRR